MNTERTRVPAKPLKLSGVKFYPRNYADACIMVDGRGYVGNVRLAGADIIGDISAHHIHTSKPTHLILEDSVTSPGDVICFPTMTDSEDYLKLEWGSKGKTAKVNMAKLLALKQIMIPLGTSLVVELNYEEHASYGPVVVMKLNNPEFRPVKSKKKQEPATGTKGNTGKPGDTGTKGGTDTKAGAGTSGNTGTEGSKGTGTEG